MKKLLKKIFNKEHMKKLLKLLLTWGGIMLLLLAIVVAVFSCQGSKEPNKKQAINNPNPSVTSFNVSSSDINNPDFWLIFIDTSVETDTGDNLINGYFNISNYLSLELQCDFTYDYYDGEYELQTSTLDNHQVSCGYDLDYYYEEDNLGVYNLSIGSLANNNDNISVYFDDTDVINIEFDLIYLDNAYDMSLASVEMTHYDSGSLLFLNTNNYVYSNAVLYFQSGGSVESEEPPVTSEPVTSEPVTSEPVTSDPVTSEPVTSEPVSSEVINQNRYVTISSYLDFNLIYGGTMLSHYVPNLYFKSNLSQIYQSNYDLEGITFYLQGEQSIKYNKIRVVFGRLSDYNFDNLQQTLEYLAFVDGDETIDSVNSSFLTYKGATNYLNLLDIDVSKLDCYYFVKEVYYIRTTPLEYLKVFDGLHTSTYTYYVSNGVVNCTLSPTSNHVTGISFARNGWLSGVYRRLVVTYDSGAVLDVPNQSLNDYTLLEYLMNNTGVNNEVIDYGFNSVFSLISGAFLSVAPILSLMILPNITIGMLLLVPLMIGIMLAIIKLIKK